MTRAPRWTYPVVLALLALGGALALLSDAGPYGWVGLAAVPGVIATRTLGRRLIAVLLVITAVAATVQFGAVLAGIVMVLGAAGLAIYAARWPILGSRYERKPADDPWAQLDRGEDPTLHGNRD